MATSQFTRTNLADVLNSAFHQTTSAAEMARALNAAFPLRKFEALKARETAILEGAVECPSCGELDGEPATYYDGGDPSVGYAPDEIECCTLCVKAVRSW